MWNIWHHNQSFSKVGPLFISLSEMPVVTQRHDTWQIQYLKTVTLQVSKVNSGPAMHLSVRIACSADSGEVLAASKSLGWMPIAQTHSRWPASRCSLLVPLSTECMALLTRMYGFFDCSFPLLLACTQMQPLKRFISHNTGFVWHEYMAFLIDQT